MQDEKQTGGAVTPTKEDAEQDATSKETVSDLGESKDSSGSETGDSPSGADNSAAPSPDGQFDATREDAGPGDEAGPM